VGGFVLATADLSIAIPVDAEQLLYLIRNHYIDYPVLSKEDIADRNKSDGLARFDYSQDSRILLTNRKQATHSFPGSLVRGQYYSATDTRLEHDDLRTNNDILRYCLFGDIFLLALQAV